jgi:hypothetical protein
LRSETTWLRRAITSPEFAERLAPFAKGGGTITLDHAAEASHSFLTALACTAAADHGKKRAWIVHESPRQRERLAAELELWGVTALVLPDSPVNPENDLHEITDPETAAEWFAILETRLRFLRRPPRLRAIPAIRPLREIPAI